MATWFRTSSGDPRHSRDAAANVFDHWEPDAAYLTDGTDLYRYLGAIPSGTSELVALENCLTLKVLLFSLDEVRALKLRGVVPAEGHSRARPFASRSVRRQRSP
jgi:hypothetical protein